MTIRLLSLSLLLPVLAACGGSDPGAGATAGASGAARYQEGVHYQRLAQPFEAEANEIVEVFSYGCPACVAFQPRVDAWKREQGDAVLLRYVPAIFHPTWEPYARAFHAAQELGALSRLHRAIYAGMSRPSGPPTTLDQLADVVAEAGIDRQRFLEAAQSPAVDAAVGRSREYVQRAGVQSTPSLVVSGRYRVEAAQPGNISPLTVVDWLVERQP